jgi:hypothetical protein
MVSASGAAAPPPNGGSSNEEASTRPNPLRAFRLALRSAQTEEKVRGFLAIFFVLVLLALLFFKPGADASAAVTSAKTLAIAVVAFYFGLHGATPHAPSEVAREGGTAGAPTQSQAPE